MTSFAIRRLIAEDVSPFYHLREEALSDSPHSYGSHLSTWTASSEDDIRRLLSAPETSSIILGAWMGRNLVGMLGLKREQKINVQHKATLWGFFVDPAFRNLGIGKALIEAILKEAEHWENLHHIRLIVTAVDTVAHQLFSKAGFQTYGTEVDGLYSGDRLYDQDYMQKFMTPPDTDTHREIELL